DYLELMAETGLIGFSLLAWFFWQGGRRLVRGFPLLSSRVLPVCIALVIALGVMAFHEFFDFNLQIPANALLFTVFFAIALRMAGNQVPSSKKFQVLSPKSQVSRRFQTPVAAGAGVVAVVLCIVAFRQGSFSDPDRLKGPTSLAEARQLLLSRPARSSTHLSLFRFLQERTSLPQQFDILETALWLDPTNPYVRDLYAQSLLQKGNEEEGLREITRSVSFSPVLPTHPYLNYRLIPWLSAKEQKAVEQGFQQAIASGNGDAAVGFGIFYDALGRFSEEGEIYEEAALRERGTDMQLAYLLAAGLAYARAEDGEKAKVLLHQAIAIAPQDPRAYQHLVTYVFAPKGNMASAKATIAKGIQKGADPFSLYFSLGEAARAAKNGEEAKAAFLQALTFQPSSFEAHLYLGLVYVQEGNFDRAVLSLGKAVDLNSTSATAFFYLGLAEEARYQFHAAEKAYARAVKLAPGNAGFHSYYEAFRRKMAAEDKAQWTQ
ncbi:MAG: tetratricopeptide repeat protein, partial [Candidatus Binatia bacterium]